MREPIEELKDALDGIHAEEALKNRTGAYVSEVLAKRARPQRARALRMAVAAVCLLLVFLTGCGSYVYFDTVFVVSVDINPSVELGINAFNRVISVRGYNGDGDALAQSLRLRFLRCEEAVERLVGSDTIRTLLEQEEYLAITVVGEDEAESAALCDRLRQHMDDHENTHYFQADAQALAQAHSCGLSYGKYRAYQEALEQGDDLTVEEARSMTMQEIREHAQAHCGEVSQIIETQPTSGGGHGKKGHSGKHHD